MLTKLFSAGFAAFAWLYVFGVAVQFPENPIPGLDHSWILALGQAASAHLVFGRDIVFTYGPLGYLALGDITPGTYAGKILGTLGIAVVLSSLLVARAWSEKSPWQRLVLLCCGAIAIGETHRVTNLADELLYALALLFTFPSVSRGQPIRTLALCLGIAGGIAALVKFSFAIDAVIVGAGIFVVRAVQHRANRDLRFADVEGLLLFFTGFAVASGAAFSAIGYGAWLGVLVPIAGIAASAIWIALSSRETPRALPSVAGFRYAAAGIAIGSLGLLVLSPPYRSFFYYSLQEVLGYSSAMSLPGPATPLVLALLLFALLAVVALRERAALGWPRVFSSLAILWLAFKEGFVRQDTHTALYFLAALLVSGILFAAAYRPRDKAYGVLAAAIALLAFAQAFRQYYTSAFDLTLPPAAEGGLHDAAIALGRWNENDRSLDGDYLDGLSSSTLNPADRSALRRDPVDFAGDETSVVFANNLRWQPAPGFQPLTAYTPALDTLDRDTIATRPAVRELLAYTSVDRRYPFADEPRTFRYILCHFTLDPAFEAPMTTQGDDAFLVLKQGPSRCGTPAQGAAGSMQWNQPFAVPVAKKQLTYVALDFRHSLAGAALALLYRDPPITMIVTYRDGSSASWRILPATSGEGLLLSSVPLGLPQVQDLLAGAAASAVTSVRFTVADPAFFSPRIGYRIEQVPYR